MYLNSTTYKKLSQQFNTENKMLPLVSTSSQLSGLVMLRFIVFMCILYMCAQRGLQRTLDLLELEFQLFVRCLKS